LSLLFSKENKERYDAAEGDPLFDLFNSLWFNYLKVQLNFAGKMKPLAPSIKDNLSKVISFLTEESQILKDHSNPETKEGEVWKKSQEVIKSFYPDF